MTARRCTLLVFLLGNFAGGCAKERIPTYPPMDESSSLHIVAQQARSVSSVSSECLITLTKPDGQSIRLDGALAMQPPNYLRLRAWKFGRAVFDLTMTPSGIWLESPENSGRKDEVRSAGISAAQLGKTWSMLSGGFFEEKGLRAQMLDGKIVARRELAGQRAIECEIDRQTLTPRRYSLLDESGAMRFSLVLDRYRQFGEVVWPTRLVATSASGTVEVELRNTELNTELATAAFVPPPRAEMLP